MKNLHQNLNSQLKRSSRKIYRLFRYHRFSLSVLICLIFILSIGIFAIDRVLWLASSMSLILFISSISYYAFYFVRFRTLIDVHNQSQHYFDLFSFRNIILFNIIFVCCFALLGTVVDRWYTLTIGKALFSTEECAAFLPVNPNEPYQISYPGMLTYLWQVVVDGGLFGLLGAFGFEPCQIPTGLKLSDLLRGSSSFQFVDLAVSIFVYFVSVVIDLAFWLSLLNEVLERLQVQGLEWLHIKSDVTKAFQSPKIDPYELTSLEQKRNTEILRRVSAGNIDIIQFEQKLFYYLGTSKNISVRDLFLRLMQESQNLEMFRKYVLYFQKIRDRRFRKVCARIRIRNVAKGNIIDEIDSRKVKKKVWRGRGKKPKN